MNIFILDTNTELCAKYHSDKHVVKMILESAQMLSNCHHYYGIHINDVYRPTHMQHPCTIWTCISVNNYRWHLSLFCELNKEFSRRFRHVHKSFDLYRYFQVIPPISYIPNTPFVQAMPIQYQDRDPVQAYRKYYINEKLSFCRYTFPADIPYWLDNYVK